MQADTPDSDFGEGRGIRKLAKIWKELEMVPTSQESCNFPKV